MEEYTNRELGIILTEIKDEIRSFRVDSVEKFNSMLCRQDKTNGRVRTLESWMMFVKGAVAILSCLVLPIVFMILKNYI